ncbi:MAG TPA: methyltransferase domain-containing protein [Thermoleophilaceae bacterium]|nr:methyltransferase domain-containing protein [Thermoleophilaceae bacterium]
MATTGGGVGAEGLSEPLRRFVSEVPYERRPILEFVRAASESLPPGVRVLDVGAGEAPYRELFDHVDYVTLDWSGSLHEEAKEADLKGSADALPLQDEEFDAVLMTQVLEHLPQPLEALQEARRVLRPGGRAYLTVPLVWELHEQPFDYWRFTAAGLGRLLDQAGFIEIEARARNDCFSTLAQLMRNAASAMGTAPDGLDERRKMAAKALWSISEQVAALAPLDANMTLPLGYAATARRPPEPVRL